MSTTATATFIATSLVLGAPVQASGSSGICIRHPVIGVARPMSTLPAPSNDTDSVRDGSLDALVAQWEEDTQFASVLADRYAHPAYQRLIELGWASVPFLLSRLKSQPGFWFHALRAITGANPVQPANVGRVRAMANDWVQWGRDAGIAF